MRLEKKLGDLKAKAAEVHAAMAVKMAEVEEKAADDAAYADWEKAYADLEAELAATADEIKKLEERQAEQMARAKRVDEILMAEKAVVSDAEGIAPVNAPAKIAPAKKLYEGDVAIRSLMTEYVARQHGASRVDVAEKLFPNDSRIAAVAKANIVKAPVAVPETGDVGINNVIVTQNQAQSELIEMLRNSLIYPRLPGMRTIPLGRNGSVRIPRETAAVAAQWVAEGNSIPVGKPSFDTITIDPYKLGVISISTKELMERSDPAYEQILRDQIIQGVAQALDTTFVSNAAAVAGSSPAGLLNGIAANATTMPAAPTAAQAINVFTALQLALAQANIEGPFVWIMSTRTMYGLMALRSAIDTPLYPELAAGQLLGYPVVTSNNVPTNLLGGGEAPIILMKASELYFGLGSGLELAVSDTAYIQSDSAPATPPTGGVSLFQQQMVAIRATLMTSWARRRDAAVSYTTSLL